MEGVEGREEGGKLVWGKYNFVTNSMGCECPVTESVSVRLCKCRPEL